MSDCILWPGKVDQNGYGCCVAGGHKRTHRLFYSLFVGPIPAGMCVLHSCDTPACVNPAHLRVGTHAENMQDRTARKRLPSGTKNWKAKLNAEQVTAIRSGLTCKEAIARFGIQKSTYYRTRNGEGYKDVPIAASVFPHPASQSTPPSVSPPSAPSPRGVGLRREVA